MSELNPSHQNLPDINEDESETALQHSEKENLIFYKKVNFGISIATLILGFLLLIDFLIYEEEYFQIPSKCYSDGHCTVDARTPSDEGNQYIYLQFDGFYQNYRNYRDSISLNQFYDPNVTKSEVEESCWGWVTNGEMKKHSSLNSLPLKSKNMAIPCGLIAFSYPNSKDWLFKSKSRN